MRVFYTFVISILIFCTSSFCQISDFKASDETGDQILKYSKFEAELKLDSATFSSILNPYNPDEVNIVAIYTSPTGQEYKRNAFYMEKHKRNITPPYWEPVNDAYPFKVRFTPDEIGTWSYRFEYYDERALISSTENKTFLCVDSSNPGFLKVSENNRYLEFSNGDSFFGIAEDLRAIDNSRKVEPEDCWPNTTFVPECPKWCYSRKTLTKDIEHMTNFKNEGGNMIRVWLEPYSYEFEWEALGDYSQRQHRAHDLDLLISAAEDLGIYIHLVLYNAYSIRDNGEECNFQAGCWDYNPYNITGATDRKDLKPRCLYRRNRRLVTSLYTITPIIFT